ncbi:hypothetical protein N7519_007275 [Penicillium mononematosum]|uniref:uncharacterized protein n=1 Tax=Penicillium mononematosum TaxID=268346 RepID=UPI0025493B62|nr:uncharacterized protein N7519_007275 [Penicillium mononematosum]KAJ6185974.1 hypothetical protein N7519_007275 [Penicillium mononematosum]
MTILSTSRRVLRYRIARALIIIFAIWNLVEIHLIQHRIYEAEYTALRHRPQKQERIYIASINWNNELILRSHWSKALTQLVLKLGRENVFISIYESGSYDNTKGALRELDWELEQMRDLARQGITFDKILFLNDVVFTPNDVLKLLDTNGGEYAAACSLDFSKPPHYYDTFALRDSKGHESIMQTWPYFGSAESRHAMKKMSPVPVASCWNGMVAMPASPFIASSPLRFRGIPDSLAEYHLEGSECCLIHTDNPLSVEKGVYLNPLRRHHKGIGVCSVGPPMAMELMLSHDFIKELAQELEFDQGAHRHTADLNNGDDVEIPVDISTKCHLRLRRLMGATERHCGREGWGEEEEEKRKKGGRGPFIPSTTCVPS